MTATVGNSAHAQQVEKILKIALDNAATEVRLGVGAPPRVLIDGQWRPIGKTPLGADDVPRPFLHADGRESLDHLRFRVSPQVVVFHVVRL